ncbi:MAG: lipoate--protein ligase family protein [Acidimicrobiales bacterium]
MLKDAAGRERLSGGAPGGDDQLALYLPEDASGVKAICYFHAMARLGVQGLVVVEPSDNFVSVGYFDDAGQALDIQRCRELGLPVVRREVGGGPVLLGPGQVFYNLVLSRSSPLLPPDIATAYRLFSAPVVDAYAAFGVEASYRPVNDLVTPSGRKISGQGAADIEGSFCFVGAVIRHFDVATMAQVLKVPDEKFRDKLHKTLADNMSWIGRETGVLPSFGEVAGALVSAFSALLGPLPERPLPAGVVELANVLAEQFSADDHVMAPTGRRHVATKVREGVYLRHGVHKAPGGLVRASVAVRDGLLDEVELSSDCTFVPRERFEPLARAVEGLPLDREVVARAVRAYLIEHRVDCPGVEPSDFAAAIVGEA